MEKLYSSKTALKECDGGMHHSTQRYSFTTTACLFAKTYSDLSRTPVWRLLARWTLLDVVQSISHTKSGCFSTCSIDIAIFYLFPIFSHVLLFCLSSPPQSWNRQVFPK